MPDGELKIHPFPEVPLMEEERGVIESVGGEKLPGAPISFKESLLLVDKEVNAILTFENKPSQDRKELCRGLLDEWVKNPEKMVEFFDKCYIISQSGEFYAKNVKDFEEYLNQNLDGLLKRVESPKADVIGKWMKLAVAHSLYKDRAQAILKGFFGNAKTPAQLIDLMYEFGITALREGDKQISDELFKTLLWNSDICKGTEKTAMQYMLALYMQAGEEGLKKFLEIDAVITQFCASSMPQAFAEFQRLVQQAEEDEHALGLAGKFVRDNPEKAEGHGKYFQLISQGQRDGSGFFSVSPETYQQWPFTLFAHPGPLRELLNKRMEEENPAFVRIRLPKSGEHMFNGIIQQELNKQISDDCVQYEGGVLIGKSAVEFLFRLRPDIKAEQLDELASANSGIKGKIAQDRVYGISPRGDRVLMLAEEAKGLKYSDVCYELNPVNPEVPIKATILVGKARVVFGINKDYDVVAFPNGEQFEVSIKQRAFLDYLILSHLYELQCSERIKPGIKDGEIHRGKNIDRQVEFRNRRSHLMKLPPSKGFTLEAVSLANDDPNHWDLYVINRQLGLTRETGQKTFVRAISVPVPGEAPIISRAPHAFDDYKKIME